MGPGRCLKGHESDILAMAVMDGHPALATACDDGTIWIWNVDSGKCGKAPSSIVWKCDDGTIWIWNVVSGKRISVGEVSALLQGLSMFCLNFLF